MAPRQHTHKPADAKMSSFGERRVRGIQLHGFLSGDGGLAVGQTGGYTNTLFDQSRPTFLVGASSYSE
jgi:hypothetical protein